MTPMCKATRPSRWVSAARLGGTFEALDTSSTASTTVTDNADATVVTLTASAASVTEGGSIVYTASVNNAVAGAPLVVTLSNGHTITIPVGASSADSGPVAVRPDDAYVQGNETVSVGISGTTGGTFEALDTSSTASTTVTDNADATVVTLTASAASVTEGGSIVYTASVNNAVTGAPLVVTLTNGHTITIPVGASSADSGPVAVRPDDAYAQGNETVSVGITGTTGGTFEALDTSSTASTIVTDDADATTVSLTGTHTVNDGGAIVYTATLTSAAQTDVTVALSNGETIHIAAGASSGNVTIVAPSGPTEVSATITAASGGNFENLTIDAAPADTVIHHAPVAIADTASAVEASGVANATAGVDPSGNVLTNDTDVDPGDASHVVAVSFGVANGTVGSALAGAHGSLVLNADGTYSYQVNNDDAAVQALHSASDTLTEVFHYTITDTAGLSASTTLTVTIHGANDAPVAVIDTASGTEDNSISGNVLLNDYDVDATGPLTVTQFQVAGIVGTFAPGTGVVVAGVGTVGIAANGSYIFQPAQDFNGPVPTLTYTISDGELTSTSTLNISLAPVNDAPVLDLDANDSSASGTASAATFVENGAAVAIGDVDLHITDPDNATLQSATITLTNPQPGDVLAAGSLPPGLTATSSGATITLSGNASLADYEAAIHAITFSNGSDDPDITPRTIHVSVNDGALESNVATATIQVVAVNDAPLNHVPGAQTSAEDSVHVFSNSGGNAISVSDVDSPSLTTTISATHGLLTAVAFAGATISGNGSATVMISGTAAAINGALDGLSYAPAADYNGNASISVTTSDGAAADTGTIAMTITPVVDIAGDNVTTNEDTPITIDVLANDSFEDAGRTVTQVNGTSISVGGPSVAVSHGSVTLDAGGHLLFTPTRRLQRQREFQLHRERRRSD